MSRRVLGTELRRGTPPLAALLAAIAMTWMLAVHPDDWAGLWGGLSTYLRVSLLILCPLFVAAGAWQAGRERRTQLEELLRTTPRPAWQPLLASWTAVTLGGLAGLMLPLVVAAVLVGSRASYLGTGWWWTALVAQVALATAAALGTLLGRLLPVRVVAPLAGLVTYVGLGVPMYLDGNRWAKLSPVIGYAGPADVWPIGYHAWQAGWLAAVAAILFLLAARRWWVALLPALAATLLLVVPARAGQQFGEPGQDPGALALVCTDRVPQVCVARVNGFMLDDVAAVIEPLLARASGVPGGPVRAVDQLVRDADVDQPDVLWVSLTGQPSLTGGVARRDWLEFAVGGVVHDTDCPEVWYDSETNTEVISAASDWLRGDPPAELAALPEDRQKQWVGAVLAASRGCDPDRMSRLAL